jgi:hypothetical protein
MIKYWILLKYYSKVILNLNWYVRLHNNYAYPKLL